MDNKVTLNHLATRNIISCLIKFKYTYVWIGLNLKSRWFTFINKLTLDTWYGDREKLYIWLKCILLNVFHSIYKFLTPIQSASAYCTMIMRYNTMKWTLLYHTSLRCTLQEWHQANIFNTKLNKNYIYILHLSKEKS